ncbi:hypothetical protein SJAG_00927 [Schizosaccharomyces japonicus yFS275]|uniref:Uncharacterized protein n=1 Tax=Schizosaccharomyces japonicus (strain yFS275 / FY16936) TaxID=402676 RepID=B6JX02_SCHJY|nr:hypothetical protein SJAG_00927 [Schizosaccharomyces japonicus yFS275]EEB05903.1 hypothetical protein SJAG_00927 [Schizosaccharomyces japonicus yFS275]
MGHGREGVCVLAATKTVAAACGERRHVLRVHVAKRASVQDRPTSPDPHWSAVRLLSSRALATRTRRLVRACACAHADPPRLAGIAGTVRFGNIAMHRCDVIG